MTKTLLRELSHADGAAHTRSNGRACARASCTTDKFPNGQRQPTHRLLLRMAGTHLFPGHALGAIDQRLDVRLLKLLRVLCGLLLRCLASATSPRRKPAPRGCRSARASLPPALREAAAAQAPRLGTRQDKSESTGQHGPCAARTDSTQGARGAGMRLPLGLVRAPPHRSQPLSNSRPVSNSKTLHAPPARVSSWELEIHIELPNRTRTGKPRRYAPD